MIEGIILLILFWLIGSLLILLNYGRSDMIEKTSNTVHLAILLVCLPATIMICIISLAIEIKAIIQKKLNK